MTSAPERSPWHTFAVAYAVALQRAGASAATVEDEVTRVLEARGVEATVMATPTALWFDVDGSRLVRVEPGLVHLGRQAELVEVGERVRDGLDPAAGAAAIADIERHPPPWSPGVERVAYMVSSGAAALTLGGTVNDAVAAMGVGLFAHFGTALTRSQPRWARLTDMLAAFAAGSAAQLLTIMGADPSKAGLASIVTLAPGLALTVAAAETGTGHWTSGTARFGGAVASLVQLGAGLALAGALMPTFDPLLPVEPSTYALRVSAAMAIPFALALLGRTRPSDVPLAVLVAYAATAVARGVSVASSGPAGALLGAITSTVLANGLGRFRSAPSAVYQSPALYVLVPGSVGVSALRAAISGRGDTETAFEIASVVVALAAGILLGHAIVPQATKKSDHWPHPVGGVRDNEGGVMNPRNLVFGVTVVAGVALDQITKIGISRAVIANRGDIDIIPNWLALAYAKNDGAAFSMFAGGEQIPLFLVFTVFALVVTVDLVRRFDAGARYVPFLLGMILAGALGNGLDRLRLGFVIDFIKVYAGSDPLKSWFIERVHTNVWPIFNVADSFLVVGVTLFVVYFLVQRDQAAESLDEVASEAP